MKFGHFFLPTYFPHLDGQLGAYFRGLVELAVASEELGFDSVWANEHHFDPYGGLLPATPVFLAAVAQRTSHVRLGTSVIVMPLHRPIEIAEQLAMVDLMSNGRLEFGVGRGYVVTDYKAMHVPLDEGQERTLEGLEVVLKAWQGKPFTHQGRHYSVEDLEVWPKPQQQPHPPVWMGCSRSPSSFEAAGQAGWKLLVIAHVNQIDRLAELIGVYRQGWAAAGHEPAACEVAAHFNTIVDSDGERARELARMCLGRSLELSAPTFSAEQRKFQEGGADRMIADGRVLVGSPDECAATLARLEAQLRITAVHCKFVFGGMGLDTAKRSMQLFAEGVMPRLRE